MATGNDSRRARTIVRSGGLRPIAVSGAPKLLPKGDNGIAIAPPLNIRTLQY